MPTRSPVVRRWLLAGAIAALCGLIYLQVAAHLPAPLRDVQASVPQHVDPACRLSPVPRDHHFVSASVSLGGRYSGLALGQVATKTVQVSVAPGSQPITVFVSGFALLWNFTGDVARVRRVVATSRTVGVVGIPADRVEFRSQVTCATFIDANSADAARRAGALAAMFGRRPDRDAYQQRGIHLQLPEGRFVLTAQAEPGAPMRVLMPADVVAAEPVTRPVTLPGNAGLDQLEHAGAIRSPTPEEVQAFLAGASRPYQNRLSPDYLLYMKFDFAITREVTLPEGFSRPPNFLVLAGVPAPRAPYRGCLAEMDGFRFNSPSSCIPWIEERIEALRRALSSHREVGGCRLLTPPDEVPLHAVSVSRPEQPRLDIQDTIKLLNGNGRDEKAFPIDVRVEAPGEIVLVLNTYQPAIWRISVAPGSRVAAVLSISYHPSRVEGLAPDIPLVMTDYKTLSATPPCRHLWSSGMEAYRGGPDAMIFDRQVQALTGRSLETLRGASNLKSIVVR